MRSLVEEGAYCVLPVESLLFTARWILTKDIVCKTKRGMRQRNGLIVCQWCQHSIWAVCILGAPLLTQVPLMTCERSRRWCKSLGPCTHVQIWRKRTVPGCRLAQLQALLPFGEQTHIWNSSLCKICLWSKSKWILEKETGEWVSCRNDSLKLVIQIWK